MLRFAEELMLLLFREESAELPAAPEAKLAYALAGALLMDLALLGRIDTDVRHLALVDETPLDDDLLDPALTAIAANTEQRSAEFWVRRLAEDAERIQARALARLREAGILEADPDASPDGLRLTFRVFHARRYPATDGQTPSEAEQEVRLRIMRVLFSDDIPHPRDIVLICLAAACGLLDRLLTREEREDCAERIDVVRRLDLIGQAVANAVRAASEAVPVATALPPRRMEKAIPEVAGLPVLGSAAAAAKDLIGLFHRSYQRYGPVFKLRLLNQRITVIAGSEANRQVHRKGRLFLRSQEVWTDFLQEVGASKVVTSLDGTEHRRLRKALARGYSRKSFESRMDVAIDICRRHIDAWPNNRPVAGKVAIQRLVVDQIGTILANVPPGKHLDDLVVFLDTLLLTRLAKMRPMILYRRKFERARKQVEALYARILREHSPGGAHADRGDLVNDVLALHRADPEFLPESDLLMACMGPYFGWGGHHRPHLLVHVVRVAEEPGAGGSRAGGGRGTVRRRADADRGRSGAARRHPPRGAGGAAPLSGDSAGVSHLQQQFRGGGVSHPRRREGRRGDLRHPPAAATLSRAAQVRHRPLLAGAGGTPAVGRLPAVRHRRAPLFGRRLCRGADHADVGGADALRRFRVGSARLPDADGGAADPAAQTEFPD